MRVLHWLLALTGALLLGAWLAPRLGDDPGYVLVRFQGWAFETSGTALALALLLILVAWQLAAWLLRAPGRAVRSAIRNRRDARLEKGLLALAEGHWSQAEKLLAANARHSGDPAVQYLIAARAAQAHGDASGRERYLALADETGEGRDLAVGLTRAELLQAEGETEMAAAVLETVLEAHPRHARALALLAECYRGLGRWAALLELLPALRRVKGVQVGELEREALCGVCRASGDRASLEGVWSSLPRRARRDAAVAGAWARRALELGGDALVAKRLPALLRSQWDTELVRLYGLASHGEPGRALKVAQGWLGKHPDDAALLLTLGRLCRQAKLPGKARHYLERSLALESLPETYREMAELLEAEGDTAGAMGCYRNLVRLRREEPVEPVAFESQRRLAADGGENA